MSLIVLAVPVLERIRFSSLDPGLPDVKNPIRVVLLRGCIKLKEGTGCPYEHVDSAQSRQLWGKGRRRIQALPFEVVSLELCLDFCHEGVVKESLQGRCEEQPGRGYVPEP